jgi:hypothetical protein
MHRGDAERTQGFDGTPIGSRRNLADDKVIHVGVTQAEQQAVALIFIKKCDYRTQVRLSEELNIFACTDDVKVEACDSG